MSGEASMSQPDKSILYVEDHEETRLMIISALEMDGYRVVTARTISAGVTLAQNSVFDLYLIDTRLPDGSGIELCHRLRSYDSVTPILFLTGVSDGEVRREALAAGAQGYIVKPANLVEMKAAMAGLIRAGRAARNELRKRG
jgi:two-component system, NtrC family, response regulator PilR